MSQRLDRVDELLREEIGAVLAREVNDPRVGFVTITRVETTPDLARALVWVSVIGTPAERTSAIRALEHAMPFVRRQLGARIRIRRIPELHVRLDESIERGTRVLKLLDDLEAGVVPDPLAPAPVAGSAESLPTPVRRLPREGDVPNEAEPPGAAGGLPAIPAAPDQGRRTSSARRPGATGTAKSPGRPRTSKSARSSRGTARRDGGGGRA